MRTGASARDSNALRVLLALSVVLRHCFPLSYGNSGTENAGFLWPASTAIVPIFFILSGFLVTGSALRLTLGKFVASRLLRIVPALMVDTMVTILLIGPIFTHRTLGEYFLSSQTHAYLLNIVGEIHYYLPGMFESNPIRGVVNGALWTIPPELGCYVGISGLIFLGWVRDWRKTLAVGLVAVAAIVAATFAPNIMPRVIKVGALHPGALLVPGFLLGSVLYLRRNLIPYSPVLFSLCVALILLSGFLLPRTAFSVMPLASVLAMPIYGYTTVFLGATRVPPLPFFRRGDYSYGIYLYGFPIQQVVVSLGVRNPLLVFVTAIGPICALAMLSWHLVEKPTLKLRKGFSLAAKREAQRDAALEKEQVARTSEMAKPR
ncbi:acyltransferase family protein [Sphingomonas sp. MMS24-J13]|uniref:acyltransferase family protein n=1 Tax=Sphingomonas sp. MMS24-J13 TaxID=3238686 RepID=UPI00384F8AC7